MAEYTIEELKALVSNYEKWKDAVSDVSGIDFAKGSLSQLDSMMSKAKDTVLGATGSFASLNTALGSVNTGGITTAFSKLFGNMKEHAEITGMLQSQLESLTGRIGAVILASSGNLTMPQEMKKMADGAEEASAKLSVVSSTMINMASIVPGLGKVLDKIKGPAANLFAAADGAREMQMGLLMSAAAAGELGEFMGSMNNDLEELTNKALQYTDHLHKIADANSLTIETTTKYATELKKIPGALDTIISFGGKAGETMDMLTGVIKVAAGTGQSYGEVMGDVNMLFEKFNVVGKDSLSFITRMSSAVQTLGMPMKFMREYVKGTAQNFKFLGDNTQAALNIMGGFGTALKDSGIGPEGIAELVGNVTGVISKLDVAQRAFVSGQTGGAGGLAGGYELAYQMQEGNADEVGNKVMETLKNMMGGNLVTLDDARKDSGAAAQMAKQVQMLTSGPLAIAGNEGQAFKIIEAMSKGTSFADEMSVGGTPDAILQTTVERGNKIQELQMNKLTEIHNVMKTTATVAALSADNERRNFLGDKSALAAGMKGNRDAAQKVASKQKVISDSTSEHSLERSHREGAGHLVKAGKGAVDAIEGMSNLLSLKKGSKVPGADKAVQSDLKQGAETESKSEAQQKASAARGESTIIIKVMSKDEVESIIRVVIGENNEIIRQDNIANSLGSTAR